MKITLSHLSRRTKLSWFFRLSGIAILLAGLGFMNQAHLATAASGPQSASPTPFQPSATLKQVTLHPAADAYVYQSKPHNNYGDSKSLRVDGDPVMRSYLRFDLKALKGARIQKATLKLYANSSAEDGFDVHSVSDASWKEDVITYKSAPKLGGKVGTAKTGKAESWISIDLTSLDVKDGRVSLALTAHKTQINLASREAGGHAPQLFLSLIEVGTVVRTPLPPAPTTPPSPTQSAGLPAQSPTPTQPAPTSAPTQAPTAVPTQAPTLAPTQSPAPTQPAPTQPTPTPTTAPTPSNPPAGLPRFSHVFVVYFENHEYSQVIGNSSLPNFNHYAQQYANLTQFYAETHPSLPNYLAVIGGDTFGITSDCTTCWINAPSLPDQLEAAHLTWKAYEENLPSPGYVGSSGLYVQKHDPFIYFDPIRLNTTRLDQHVVPLTQLWTDAANGNLPNFAFITPNVCDDAHSCSLSVADSWLPGTIGKLISSPAFDANSVVVLVFDEGTTSATCCQLGSSGGGHIPAIVISPLVKSGYQDNTPYTHYSLLKTIESAWGLPLLKHAGDAKTNLISAPWK